MYGALPELACSPQKEEGSTEGFRAYAWINDSSNDFQRMRDLDNYIQKNIIKREDNISVEDVRDTLMDMILHNDYDEDKAYNGQYCVTMKIKNFIYKYASFAYKKVKADKDPSSHAIRLDEPISNHSSKDEEDSLCIADTVQDGKASTAFNSIVMVDLFTTVDKIMKVTNTVYEGFLAMVIINCLCGEDAYKYRNSIINMLGLEHPTYSVMNSDDVMDVVTDLAKFGDAEFLEALMIRVPSTKQLVNFITTAKNCIKQSRYAVA